MDAATWYSLVSVSTSSVALFLAAYVVRKVPNRRAGDTFVVAMTFFLLAAVFAFLSRADERFGPLLDRWTGDVQEVRGLEAMAGRLML
jgi:hypothetical protein